MTNPNSAFIAVVLDKSGSMEGIRADTIGSFNTFLDQQKKLNVDVRFTLTLFDTDVVIVNDAVAITHVAPLTADTYQPRGMTALLDAIGKTVGRIGERLAAMSENERPGRVVVAILTDGQENSSIVFKDAQIRELIKKQTETYSWQFVFLGADLSAIDTAVAMGIPARNAMSYNATQRGVGVAISSLNNAIANYASGATLDASFTDQDRAANEPQP